MKPTEYIREVRLAVDKIYNSFALITPSAEVTLAKRSIELSKMWFGEVLGVMNEANPYPESSNPNNNVIERQAEHSENTLLSKFEETEKQFVGASDATELIQVSRIKSIRQELEFLYQKIEVQAPERLPDASGKIQRLFEQGALKITESKMWLGRELNRIREVKEASQKA